MDELDFAKRAVARNLLTPAQLREAETYAEGGRSLLSVLLDLGYLKPDHLAELARPPAVPARSLLKGFFSVAAAAVLGLILLGVLLRPAPPFPRVVYEFGSIDRVLVQRGTSLLSSAEQELRRAGTLSAETERKVQHAAALLQQAVTEGAGDAGTLNALGRAHELLDHPDAAAEWYRKALRKDERDDEANLGLARVLLLLDRPLQAHEHASAACRGERSGEAYLIRARAGINLGNREDARADLEQAARLDPSLAAQVRALRVRLND